MHPTVSIIVPVYNAEKTLARCVDSILNQTYEDYELLLVNDGSTDSSGALCDAYAARDSRVQVFHKENAGVSNARNLALSQARGTYLQFLDSDDWITPEATLSLVRAAEDHQCDLVISDFYRVVGERVSHKGDIDEDTVLTREEYAAHMMENPADFYYGVLWNKLFLGDVVRENGLRFPVGMNWGEDFVFVTEYLAHVRRVAFLTRPVYDYHRSLTGMVARQFMDCARHPLYNVQLRLRMYRSYRELYQRTGQYPRHRRTLWLYLFRFTLHN